MRLDRIIDNKHQMYEKAMKLYKISFPEHEQREEISQKNILKNKEYKFELIYDEDIFVGIVLYWETKEYIYIEHFCILPEMRNKKYGEKVLNLMKEKNKTVILEIDPPIDEISVKRKNFYNRSEFVENKYYHVHPPYHKGNQGHKLVIMTYPDMISESEYNSFRDYLYNKVMDNVF